MVPPSTTQGAQLRVSAEGLHSSILSWSRAVNSNTFHNHCPP